MLCFTIELIGKHITMNILSKVLHEYNIQYKVSVSIQERQVDQILDEEEHTRAHWNADR